MPKFLVDAHADGYDTKLEEENACITVLEEWCSSAGTDVRVIATADQIYSELIAHRKFLEQACPPEDGFCEDFDILLDLGLIVEVKPTQEFMEEWGDDCPMYVYKWNAHNFEPVGS